MAIFVFQSPQTSMTTTSRLYRYSPYALRRGRWWLTRGWLWLHYWCMMSIIQCRKIPNDLPISFILDNARATAYLMVLHNTRHPASIWHNGTPSPGTNSEQWILLFKLDKGRCTHKRASKMKTKTQVITVINGGGVSIHRDNRTRYNYCHDSIGYQSTWFCHSNEWRGVWRPIRRSSFNHHDPSKESALLFLFSFKQLLRAIRRIYIATIAGSSSASSSCLWAWVDGHAVPHCITVKISSTVTQKEHPLLSFMTVIRESKDPSNQLIHVRGNGLRSQLTWAME